LPPLSAARALVVRQILERSFEFQPLVFRYLERLAHSHRQVEGGRTNQRANTRIPEPGDGRDTRT